MVLIKLVCLFCSYSKEYTESAIKQDHLTIFDQNLGVAKRINGTYCKLLKASLSLVIYKKSGAEIECHIKCMYEINVLGNLNSKIYIIYTGEEPIIIDYKCVLPLSNGYILYNVLFYV